MPTRKEVDQKFLALHSDLEARYYERKEISKEVFDQLHGQLWDDHEAELVAYGLSKLKRPPRDLEAEIDELKGLVKEIKEQLERR